MENQENIVIKIGYAKLIDESGKELGTIELTPNMFIILDTQGNPIIRVWRQILDFLHQKEASHG